VCEPDLRCQPWRSRRPRLPRSPTLLFGLRHPSGLMMSTQSEASGASARLEEWHSSSVYYPGSFSCAAHTRPLR